MDSNNPAPQVSNPAPVVGGIDGPITLLKFGWNILTKHWKAVGLVIVLPYLISVVGQLLAFIGGPIGAILMIILVIISVIFTIASMPAAIQAVHRVTTDPGTPVSLKSQYRFGFSLFWSFILVAIITGLANIGSFILLIIPGIVVAVYTVFYLYTLTLDGKRGFAALTESFALVRGRWWPVLGNFLFLGVVAFVINIILVGVQFLLAAIFGISSQSVVPSIGFVIISLVINLLSTAIIGPIGLGYVYKLYTSLKATRPAGEVSTKTFKGWLIAFLVIGILGGIGLFASVPLIALNTARNVADGARLDVQARQAQVQQLIDQENQRMMQGNQ